MLTSLADVPGVKLLIVGEGPAEKRLRTLLPQALFLGFLDGRRLSQAYACLDVFVHTGADETYCQAVQEAMASGVPVVAPASGGPLDLVEPGRTGLLYAPDSRADLRAAVAALVEDGELRARWSARARASVERRTWNAVNDQLLGHYRDVCRARVEFGAAGEVFDGPVIDGAVLAGPGVSAAA